MLPQVAWRTVVPLFVGIGIFCQLPVDFRRAAAQGMLILNAKDDGRTIELGVATRFGVDLPVQIGTGFVWQVAGELPDSLKLISSETLRPGQTGVVGGSGIQRLVLEVVRPGRSTLSFRYRRPWEKRPPAQTFTVVVVSR